MTHALGRARSTPTPQHSNRGMRILFSTFVWLSLNAGAGWGACADGVIDPGEQCDNGGTCIGGSRAGDACTSETECVDGGACFGGLDDLRACNSDDECRLGSCRRCRPVGGDGCAANCTFETDVVVRLVAGVVAPNQMEMRFGTSGAVVYGPFLTAPLPLFGFMILTVGRSVDRVSSFVIKEGNVDLPAIPVASSACACVHHPAQLTCGGTLLDADGNFSSNCDPDTLDFVECPIDRPCAPVAGGGNSGSGFIACGATSFHTEIVHDCNAGPGQAPPYGTLSTMVGEEQGVGAEAHARIAFPLAVGTVVGQCTGTTPDYGPDGVFCTEDDAISNRGRTNPLLFTTGSASGTVVNAGNSEDILGPIAVGGRTFACNDTDDSVDISNGVVSGAFTACDQPTVSDIVVPISFAFAQTTPLPGRVLPTPTPGADDCCQCDEPLACALPTGDSCGPCALMRQAVCEEDGSCAPWTPTPAATPTPTPSVTSTRTSSPTFTITSTRTVTPTPLVFVALTDIRIDCGAPAGTRASFDANLAGRAISGIETDLLYDDNIVDIDTDSCRMNPALGPNLALVAIKSLCGSFPQPDECPIDASANISVVTARILGAGSLREGAIPAGRLYTCELEIKNPARLPSTVSVHDIVASDSRGIRIRSAGIDGRVEAACTTPTPTPSPVTIACAGDCDGSGTVTVDELVILVNVGLGHVQLDACSMGDTNGDRKITVDEIITATGRALEGCVTSP